MIVILMLAIIVGAITATAAASPWKFVVLSDLNYHEGLNVAANTLDFLLEI
jgi:hypothetical protein